VLIRRCLPALVLFVALVSQLGLARQSQQQKPGSVQRAELPGTVTGQILSSTGAPAAGVRVGLMDASDVSNPTVMGVTMTDADGRYRLERVTPGRYYIFAGALDLPTYYPGATQLSRATVITVAAESVIGNPTFTLARATEGFKISGRVALHMENPPAKVQGVAMLFGPEMSDMVGSANVSEDGGFVISGVRPGVYLMNVILGQRPQGLFDLFGADGAIGLVCPLASCGPGISPLVPSIEAIPLFVTVRDKDVAGIETVVPRSVEIAGVVTTENGEPLPDFDLLLGDGGRSASLMGMIVSSATIRFAGSSSRRPLSRLAPIGADGSWQVSTDGAFRVTMQEGEHLVRSDALPEDYYFKTLSIGSTDLLRAPLKISATETRLRIVGVLARSPARVNVTGLFRGATGAALPAGISLVNMNGSIVSSPIQPDGKFSLSRVAPGVHAVRLNLASGLQVFADSITVPETDQTGLEITPPPLRNIVGRAVLRGEGPLPTFTLIVSSGLREDGKGLVDLNSPSAIKRFVFPSGPKVPFSAALTISPLPDGTFRFTLPEGEYQIALALRGLVAPLADRASESRHDLQSLTFGSADLLTEPMKVTRNPSELKITLTVNDSAAPRQTRNAGLPPQPPIPPMTGSIKVTGSVVGGPATATGQRLLRLQDVAVRTTLESRVDDGRFAFDGVAPGVYLVSIVQNGQATIATPAAIAVGAGYKSELELEIRPGDDSRRYPQEESTGVIMTRMMTMDDAESLGGAPFAFKLPAGSNEAAAVANLRTINTAEITFLSVSGGIYGEISTLVAAGLLDSRFNNNVVSGYSFLIVANGGDYVAAAIPANRDSGQYAFFSSVDGVVRFPVAEHWAPLGLAGQPVQ
jgi:hypothetical protein